VKETEFFLFTKWQQQPRNPVFISIKSWTASNTLHQWTLHMYLPNGVWRCQTVQAGCTKSDRWQI